MNTRQEPQSQGEHDNRDPTIDPVAGVGTSAQRPAEEQSEPPTSAMEDPPGSAESSVQLQRPEAPEYTDPRTCLARAQLSGVQMAITFLGMNMRKSDEYCQQMHLPLTNDQNWPSLLRERLFPLKDGASGTGYKDRSISTMTPDDIAQYLTPYTSNYGIHPSLLEAYSAERQERTLFWAETLERSALKINRDILSTAASVGPHRLEWGTLVAQLTATSKWVHAILSEKASPQVGLETAARIFQDGETLSVFQAMLKRKPSAVDSSGAEFLEHFCREFQEGSGHRLACSIWNGTSTPEVAGRIIRMVTKHLEANPEWVERSHTDPGTAA